MLAKNPPVELDRLQELANEQMCKYCLLLEEDKKFNTKVKPEPQVIHTICIDMRMPQNHILCKDTENKKDSYNMTNFSVNNMSQSQYQHVFNYLVSFHILQGAVPNWAEVAYSQWRLLTKSTLPWVQRLGLGADVCCIYWELLQNIANNIQERMPV